MHDPTTVIWRCTAQLPSGKFCDSRSMPDTPFPICVQHADILFDHMGGVTRYPDLRSIANPSPTVLALMTSHTEQAKLERREYDMRRDRRMQDQSQVYYVRIGDRVKIGFTINMKQRMVGLRVPLENVLATEPGGRDLELERHSMFKAERHGRLEEFNPSRRLLAHIEAIKAEHGEPRITTYVNGAA